MKGWEEEEVCGVCSGVLPVQRAPSVPRGALRWSRRGGGHGRGGPEGTAAAAAAAAALGEGGVGGKGTDRKAEEKKPTAPGIPRRSPIQVLTRPDPA